jgi:hypothetical protein
MQQYRIYILMILVVGRWLPLARMFERPGRAKLDVPQQMHGQTPKQVQQYLYRMVKHRIGY